MRMVVFQNRLLRILISSIIILILSWILAQSTQAASIYLVPDTANVPLGSNYSMAVINGNPILSYRSQLTASVVVAACTNPACTTQSTNLHTIENVLSQGIGITVIDGNPFVVYSELVPTLPNRLKVAACSDPSCAQLPTIRTLETNPIWNVNVTLHAGKPLIIYDEISSDTAHNVVKLAICTDALCEAPPIIRRFESTQGINGNAGLGIGVVNGNPVMAYTTKDGGLRLLTCLTPTCSDIPLIQTIEPDGLNVWGLSMSVIDSTIIMSYSAKDATRSLHWLKVAACVDPSCVEAPTTHIVDQVSPYAATSITGVGQLPMIAYVKEGIRLATCLNLFCNYSYANTIADPRHNYPLIQASGENPVISFLDSAPPAPGMNIKIYYGGDFSSNPPPTASITPSQTNFPTVTNTPIMPPNEATQTAVAILSATFTPSITPTPSPSKTPTPTLEPSATLITPTSPANATLAPHFFAVRHPTLTWSRVSWAQGYQIEIDDDPAFGSPIPIIGTADANTLMYIIEYELPNGVYYWHVQAKKNAIDWGNWSATETIIVSAP